MYGHRCIVKPSESTTCIVFVCVTLYFLVLVDSIVAAVVMLS